METIWIYLKQQSMLDQLSTSFQEHNTKWITDFLCTSDHSLLLQFVSGIFLAALTICYLLQIHARNRRISRLKQHYGCKPAPKIPRPLLGIPAALKFIQAFKSQRFLTSVQWLFNKRGHTFTVAMPMGRPAVWTDEPANIKACLSDNFEAFEIGVERHKVMLPIIGKGIFTSDGKEWSHFRAMIRPSFSRSQVADLEMFESHICNLVARIPKYGTAFDMQELFYDFTMDTTTDFLFGFSAGSLLPDAGPENKEFSNAFSLALGRTLQRGNWGLLMNLIPDRKFRNACLIVQTFVDRLVQQALTARGRPLRKYVYLQELAKSTSDSIELRNHAVNILVAGRDTTAALLSFIFFLLSRNAEVWRNLQTEIDELGGEKPTLGQLKRLSYLHFVINEALRLYPPVPFNMRIAKVDTVLPVGGGPSASDSVFVAKGDAIMYSVWAMHRRNDIWGQDAGDFRPERWNGRQTGWEFLPFNGGPRICIGQSFALVETAYVMVRLLQTFESIQSEDARPWKEKLGLTLSSLNGVIVSLRAKL